MAGVFNLRAAKAAAAIFLVASTGLSLASTAAAAAVRDSQPLQRERQSAMTTAAHLMHGQDASTLDALYSHPRDLQQTRTRRARRSRRPRGPPPPRTRRSRRARGGSTPSPSPDPTDPADPPAPPPSAPPPNPLPIDNPDCPEAPTNLWINELVWRVNGPGEFLEVAGPPGADSTGWVIGVCDEGDGSEGPQITCRGTMRVPGTNEFALKPVPPLQESGGLGIALLEFDVRPGTDQGLSLINPCDQVIHAVVYAGIARGNSEDNEQNDNLEFLDANFFPLGTSMSLTGQGTSLADFSTDGVGNFVVAEATPGTVNAGQNTGPPLPVPPTPPASCAGLAPLWINEINSDRSNIGEFWEVAAAPGAESTGWTLARCQESTIDGITRPIGCGTSRVPIPRLQETASGLLVATETATLRNVDSREQGLGLFNPCGELTQLVTFDGDLLREVDGVQAVVLEDFLTDFFEQFDDGRSFGLVGAGSAFEDFEFVVLPEQSPGDANAGQSLA